MPIIAQRSNLQMVNTLQNDWSTVGHEHEHISPTWPGSLVLAGFTVPAVVTPYHSNGNILEYSGRHPSVDRLNLVCQAASALVHIHSKGIVHGNISPVRFAPGHLRI
jgi:serine/threonine protein kinase